MPTKDKTTMPRAVAAKPARKAAVPKAAVARPVAAKSPVTAKAAPTAKAPAPAKATIVAPAPAPAAAPVAVVTAVAPKKVEAAKSTSIKTPSTKSAPARQAPATEAEAPAVPKAAPQVVIPGAEALPKVIKDIAETNVAQARDAFATVRQSTEALAAGFGSGGEAAAEGIKSFQAALVEALQANTDATLGYWRSLGGVKTMSEAIELQAHTARKQFEALHAQAKTLAGIASRTAQETTAPVRQALDATLRRAS